LGAALDGRLAALVSLAAILACGCSTDPGPNDPAMTPGDEATMRDRAYTEEQKQAREQRPR
jgi:hypothetical protein